MPHFGSGTDDVRFINSISIEEVRALIVEKVKAKLRDVLGTFDSVQCGLLVCALLGGEDGV